MNFLDGLKNFLQLIEANYMTILVCIGIIIGFYQKAKIFFKKDKQERYEIAKQQIREVMLKKITTAEIDFAEWNKSGSIKRSQVIEEIYKQFPILSKMTDQEAVVAWIDEEINNSLKTLRTVVKENENKENGNTVEVVEENNVG